MKDVVHGDVDADLVHLAAFILGRGDIGEIPRGFLEECAVHLVT